MRVGNTHTPTLLQELDTSTVQNYKWHVHPLCMHFHTLGEISVCGPTSFISGDLVVSLHGTVASAHHSTPERQSSMPAFDFLPCHPHYTSETCSSLSASDLCMGSCLRCETLLGLDLGGGEKGGLTPWRSEIGDWFGWGNAEL